MTLTYLKFLSGSTIDEVDVEYCSTLRMRSVADLGDPEPGAREESARPPDSPMEAVRGPCPNGEKFVLAMSTTRRFSSVIPSLFHNFTPHNFTNACTRCMKDETQVAFVIVFGSTLPCLLGCAGQALTQASLFQSALTIESFGFLNVHD